MHLDGSDHRFTRIRIGLVAVAVSFACVAAACGSSTPSASSGGITNVTVALGTKSTTLAEYWAASSLGYFRQQGLQVTITPLDSGSAAVALAYAGRVDILDTSVGNVLGGISTTGKNLYPFFTTFYKDFWAWVVPANSSLRSLSQLGSGVVGVTSLGGGETPVAEYDLSKLGITPVLGKNIVAIGENPETAIADLKSGAIQTYVNSVSTLNAITAAGFNLRYITPASEAGYLAAQGSVAAPSIAHKTAVLVRFGRALAEAQLYCLTNPTACINSIARAFPTIVPSVQTGIADFQKGEADITPPKVNGKYVFGEMYPASWRTSLSIYSQGGSAATVTNPSRVNLNKILITNLVSQINDFDYSAVVARARKGT